MLRRVFRPILMTVLLLIGAGISTAAFAQAPNEAEMRKMMEQMQKQMAGGGPDSAQMQKLMEQAAVMQQCMEDIDQASLDAMRVKGESLSREVKALCDAGKRDDAQERAIKYGREMSASPELKKMKECSAGMQDMLPQLAAMIPQTAEDGEANHVCDGF